MADLDALLQAPGVLAAFEARGNGDLLDHRIGGGGLSAEVLDLVTHMCAANMSIAVMQARGWERMSDMRGFDPATQFTLIGFECSITVSTRDGNLVGVVTDNDALDLEAVSRAVGEA